MKFEAIKRQGKRSDLTSPQLAAKFRSDDEVAKGTGVSGDTIRRYIRLNELIPPLQEMVEENRLKFNPAVELSYLAPEEQQQFFEYIQSEECTPSLSQAQQLKAASRENSLNEEKLSSIMTARAPSVAPREQQVSIPLSKLHRYFPAAQNSEQMIAQIFRVLDAYLKKRQLGQER